MVPPSPPAPTPPFRTPLTLSHSIFEKISAAAALGGDRKVYDGANWYHFCVSSRNHSKYNF